MTRSRPLAWVASLALPGILFACCAGLLPVLIVLAIFRNPPTAGGPAVVYLLDASARMQQPAEGGQGQTRLEVARAVLAELIRPADPSLASGLRVFGSGSQADPCRDTHLAVPFGSSNQPGIILELNTLVAGPSPDAALSTAMVAAIRDLSGRPGPHRLIVVTGGADTCTPDGGQLVAAELARTGIRLASFVIGFQVSVTEQAAVTSMIAGLPGATFVSAESTIQLASAVDMAEAWIASPSDLLTGLAPSASSTRAPTSTLPATSGPVTGTPSSGDTPEGSRTPSAGPASVSTASEAASTTMATAGVSQTPSPTLPVRLTQSSTPRLTPVPGQTLSPGVTPTPTPDMTREVQSANTAPVVVTEPPPSRVTISVQYTEDPGSIFSTKPPAEPPTALPGPTPLPPAPTEPPAKGDQDGDGVPDEEDRCPDTPGPADPRGCPQQGSDAPRRLTRPAVVLQ